MSYSPRSSGIFPFYGAYRHLHCMVVKVKLQLKSYYNHQVPVCEHTEFRMVVIHRLCVDCHKESRKGVIN